MGSGPWGARQNQDGPRGYDDSYSARPPIPPLPSGPWSGNTYRGPSAGSSFLTGALGTAAGVAGGMLLANSLSGLFSNHMSGAGLGNPLSGASAFGASEQPAIEETVVNNYYDDDAIREASDNAENRENGNENDNDAWQQADYPNDDSGSDVDNSDDSFDV